MTDQPDLRPGRAKCLKCDQMFDSRDVCTNRICPTCTRANGREYIPRVTGSRIYSGDGRAETIESDSN
jgi:hypothetical protein